MSSRQLEAINHCFTDDYIFAAVGAVRSGKTAACIASHCRYVLGHPEMRRMDHGIIGVTEGTIRRNLIFPEISYLSILRALGVRPYTASAGGYHLCIPLLERTMRIWMIGAQDTTVAVDRVAGATWGSVHIDEGARIPEEVWDIVLSRLSGRYSKVWTGLNPGGTRHWFRRRFVNRTSGDSEKARVVTFNLSDNPGIPKEAINRLERSFTGHTRKRLIEGIWSDASGLVWPKWVEAEVGDELWKSELHPGSFSDDPVSWSVGISWSSAGVFGAVIAAHPNESRETGVVVADRIRDPSLSDPLSDLEHGKETVDWIRSVSGRDASKVMVVVNKILPNVVAEEIERSGYALSDAETDELGGIQETGSRLADGSWRISLECNELLNEIPSYLWDEEWAKAGGEDRPQKEASPLCDALRHIAHAPPLPSLISTVHPF